MAELAAAAGGCSGRHLQMVETLGRRPSPELAARLCTVLSERTGRVVKPSEIHDGGGRTRTRTSPAA